MGIGMAVLATSAVITAGTTAYTTYRAEKQAKKEKKRTDEAIAKMEQEKKAEKRAEQQRQVDFFESNRQKRLARRQRTQRTFAGMQQEFNPAIMKQKLGQ